MDTITLLLTIFTVSITYSTQNKVITHDTRLGRLTGTESSVDNVTLYQFRKIPFASPPIGSLRFEKPKPIGAWNSTLDAKTYGPACFQDESMESNLVISEDCLHLNIFAPNDLVRGRKRPVMVWIFGGGFTNGQSMSYDCSTLAVVGNVTVVTVNYRVNIFGFVNAGNGSTRNAGLWDQQLAIKWVKDNIEDYGGDPQTITIFGESAGGASVSLQAIIPSNKGLFQRAIAESGSSITAIRDIENSTKLTMEIGRILNCSECMQKAISCLDCLKRVPASDLHQAYLTGVNNLYSRFSVKNVIGPVVDNDLIPEDPRVMLSNPSSAASVMFNSIDFISGTNDGEASLFYYSLIDKQDEFNFNLNRGIPSRVICDHVAPYLSREIFRACDHVSKAICNKYSHNGPLVQQTHLAVNLYGDVEFSSLAVRDLDFHTRSRKGTYEYYFTHKPMYEVFGEVPSWLQGASHGDEIPFIFGLNNWYPDNANITSYESHLSQKMMTYWLNFAKTGDPNPKGTTEWSPYIKSNRSYALLGEYRPSTVAKFHERMRFWNEEIPNIISRCPKDNTHSEVNSGFGF